MFRSIYLFFFLIFHTRVQKHLSFLSFFLTPSVWLELLADMYRVGFLFFFPFSYTFVHSPAETCHSLLQVFRVQVGRVQSLVHMFSSSASLEKLSSILLQSTPLLPHCGCHLLISITQLSSMLPKAYSLQLCKKLSTEVLYSELQLRPALNHAGLSFH